MGCFSASYLPVTGGPVDEDTFILLKAVEVIRLMTKRGDHPVLGGCGCVAEGGRKAACPLQGKNLRRQETTSFEPEEGPVLSCGADPISALVPFQ